MPTREEFEIEKKRFVALPPVPYRDFLIKQVCFTQPYYIRGKFIFLGWNVLNAKGTTNVSPAATWYMTVGAAKTAIDCMYEAGGVAKVRERDRSLTVTVYDNSGWAKRFWALMDERNEEFDRFHDEAVANHLERVAGKTY